MVHMTNFRHSLLSSQGIAEFDSAMPNPNMPNENQSVRHIGHRLKDEMTARNLSEAEVGDLFGVKAPSVYDWIKFGRIAKKHLPRLVEVFGHSVHWWLTEEELPDVEHTGLPRGWTRLVPILQGRSDEEIERIARALELLIGKGADKEIPTRHHHQFSGSASTPEKKSKSPRG